MCYFCGQKFNGDKVYRSTVCEKCGRELKTCLNCCFYDKNSHWNCRETISEEVHDKENANFCEFFVYQDKQNNDNSLKKSQDAKNNFLKLFGDI